MYRTGAAEFDIVGMRTYGQNIHRNTLRFLLTHQVACVLLRAAYAVRVAATSYIKSSLLKAVKEYQLVRATIAQASLPQYHRFNNRH
jgi:hypothetical protein